MYCLVQFNPTITGFKKKEAATGFKIKYINHKRTPRVTAQTSNSSIQHPTLARASDWRLPHPETSPGHVPGTRDKTDQILVPVPNNYPVVRLLRRPNEGADLLIRVQASGS
ncbi:hypothetical protein RRG08_047407 [Elysia crispata]|uniref:Uncharacterized protein n=1 Tax=Elysia crispata TaxID=231223 RepID=A0AAE1D4M4_9GAST|nr:hypothetical protein RRG08_047407 [Elysia crispata]